MTYEDYRKAFGVSKLIKVGKNLDDFTEYVNDELPAKAVKVIRKILNERIDDRGDLNHITLKLSICKDYIESLYDKDPLWNNYEDKPVDKIIAGKNIRTFNDAVSLLSPAFYSCNMKFSKVSGLPIIQDSSWGITLKDSFSLSKMSSGERQMLYSLSYVLYHIKNIQSVREDDNRVAYHNICLMFDEAELYFHPDYQRRFLGMLLESPSWCNIDTKKIHSIQILIVTHSPFVLSDMLVQNSLYLKDGEPVEVKRETFGANYYTMLNKSFFFEKRAIGDVSGQVIGEWIRKKNNREIISEEKMALVGDELLRNYLKRKDQYPDDFIFKKLAKGTYQKHVQGNPQFLDHFNEIVYDIFVTNGYDVLVDTTTFISNTHIEVCPYCGNDKVIESRRSKNEIDHFLPKRKYPILALSYYNLIPSCHFCNTSDHKGQLSPIEEAKRGLFVWNPYLFKPVWVRFHLDIYHTDIFEPSNFSVMVGFKDKRLLDGYDRFFDICDRYASNRHYAAEDYLRLMDFMADHYYEDMNVDQEWLKRAYRVVTGYTPTTNSPYLKERHRMRSDIFIQMNKLRRSGNYYVKGSGNNTVILE